MDRLQEIFTRQMQLQQLINGYALGDQDDETRIANIKENVLACTDELHEALHEVGWKKWASSRHINEEKFKKEIIDAFHFLLNLALHAGMDSYEFFDKFIVKNTQNFERQRNDYDGVTEKCPHCASSLDDVGVNQGTVLGATVFLCGHCGKGIPLEQVLGSKLLGRQVRAAKIMNQS